MTPRDRLIASALVGYLAGSINSGVVASKLVYRDDVREHGSGNAGATNMARTFGIDAGVLTLAGDVLKTVLSAGAGWILEKKWGLLVSGASCLVGHCYPLFFKFKGGKGVAVGAALSMMIDPRVFLSGASAFALGFATTKRVSVGSIASAIAVPVSAMSLPLSYQRKLLSLFAAAVVLYEHRPNVERILEGKEPEFQFAKKETARPSKS